MTSLPPCARWGHWIGREVEGNAGIGERTLFIRSSISLPELYSLVSAHLVTRIWFCKENTQYYTMAILARGNRYKDVCVEATLETLPRLPQEVKDLCRIYLKLGNLGLRKGAHICVGPAFYDEAFELGTGVKVSPIDYLKDYPV